MGSNSDFPTIAIELRDVVRTTARQLARMSDAEAERPWKPGKWTRKQLVSHLIDSASNNHQRFTRAALAGPLTFPGYDQEGLTRLQQPNAIRWSTLTMLWESYNEFLAHVIERLPAESAATPCTLAGDTSGTLGFIARDYLEHLKHHVNQMVGSSLATTYTPEG